MALFRFALESHLAVLHSLPEGEVP